MKNMTSLIIVLSIVVFFVLFADPIISRQVYGGFIPDSESVPFLEKYLSFAEINPNNDRILSLWKAEDNLKSRLDFPFIAHISGVKLLAKYYVHDYGMIGRWTEAHKLIDARYHELLKALPPKTDPKLSDLI